MELLTDIAGIGLLAGPLDLAVGVFDGVHRGHAAVIGSAVGRGGTAVVVSFRPHPAAVLRPGSEPAALVTAGQRRRLLEDLGVDALLEVRFDAVRAGQSAEDFVRELVAAGGVRSIAAGEGFRFGRGRAGDMALMARLGDGLGFEASAVPPVRCASGEVVSSTRIRMAVGEGDLDRAAELLGRRYSLGGPVVEGRRLGRTIGFPTANIADLPAALPPRGVYVVDFLLAGSPWPAVANLGVRPTVEAGAAVPLLETHLLENPDCDLYGRECEVVFRKFLRAERRFADVEALRSQIRDDVAVARDFHGREGFAR